MIKVDIKRSHHVISEITIKDHAGYKDKGEDLVCAGVSCIAIGTLNALDRLCSNMCDLNMKDAYIRIAVREKSHHDTQMVLETMCVQLMTMQETYNNFINITDQEV